MTTTQRVTRLISEAIEIGCGAITNTIEILKKEAQEREKAAEAENLRSLANDYNRLAYHLGVAADLAAKLEQDEINPNYPPPHFYRIAVK